MNLRSKSIGPTNDFEKGLMTFLRNEKEEKKCVLQFKMHVFPSSKIPDHPMGIFCKEYRKPNHGFCSFSNG